MKNDSMYQERVMDHANNPRNNREMDNATVMSDARNVSCGDTLTMYLRLSENGETIEEASFQGEGCALSTASASLLTEHVVGKKVSEVRLVTPGDLYNLLGVSISPARTKCVLTSYNALERCMDALKVFNDK